MYASIGEYGNIIQLSSHQVQVDGARLIYVGSTINADTHYIGLGGLPVVIPVRPSSAHVFDWPSHQWVDPRTLTEHQDAKWEEIKTAREAAFNAPLATPHGVFDSGARDRTNITDAVLMAQTLAALGQPVSINFTLANNTTVTLNAAQMVEVGLALGAKVQAAYAIARALRTAIAAAPTIAVVQAISWP